jgi:hypothetical protein
MQIIIPLFGCLWFHKDTNLKAIQGDDFLQMNGNYGKGGNYGKDGSHAGGGGSNTVAAWITAFLPCGRRAMRATEAMRAEGSDGRDGSRWNL